MNSTTILKIVGHACTLLFWVAFFFILLPGLQEKTIGMSRTLLIGGAAVALYVCAHIVKRRLLNRGVPESELKHMAK